jgi:AraC family transcriptional regulator
MKRYLGDPAELSIRLSDMDYHHRINTVVTIIWEQSDKQLTLQELSAIAVFSPFHFHRIFAAFVGEPLGEYIRRIKLVRACQALVHTQNK